LNNQDDDIVALLYHIDREEYSPSPVCHLGRHCSQHAVLASPLYGSDCSFVSRGLFDLDVWFEIAERFFSRARAVAACIAACLL